ncbi:xanthine dehydrogenase family protein subunit M [Paraburkholderia sp. LEh10]|uniref:FAD binding domain-containing protein n=1 Tax=Paraburkholderia sp. LEh10 TaxID=2821353 RepID=UPI001AE89DE9|nr:xanthine dehydrogenase family protein subunit M [Paraburkholderia sp. LEh10]MBP0590393.1 xanthine dehydrogenase family protein subunit M [Paraburkholderia sp. LEh10]
MYDFEYHRPSTVSEAVELLRGLDEPKLLAGGMSLLPALKHRLARPEALIDLSHVEGLRGITLVDDALTLGAMTPHVEVARSEIVRSALPALASLAGGIADTQVRYRGTVGGSIANNDPSADYPAACLALDAVIHTDRRAIAAGEFFSGLFSTSLESDEIVTSVTFRPAEAAAYVKFRSVASGYATVGVFVSKGARGTRVAVTGAGIEGVFRVREMEKRLDGQWHPDAIEMVQVPSRELSGDMHASAEYRAHLITVLARRAVSLCSS